MADRWGYEGYTFPNLTNTSAAWSGLSSTSRPEPISGATASNQPPERYNGGPNSYTCSECGYRIPAATAEDITRHMLTHIGPAQPTAISAMGQSTVHSMYGGMPSTVTSSDSNGVTPMHSYHHYSQSNAFPSAYPPSAFPGQQRPSHSAVPGHDRMSQYAYPGHDLSSHGAFLHQERPSLNAFPGQERLSQSAFPGHGHPSPSIYPGQSPPQNVFPGHNRPPQNVFPGQSPPQNAFPGQPHAMNVFPGQMPPHYSQPKPPPLIPAPHLQNQLANQQNQLDNTAIIESIYSYPPSKPKESIPISNLQDSNSISELKESDTAKPKESDSKLESTPQKIKKAESEIDFAKPIFIHSKVLEKKKKSISETIESVIKSHTREYSDEDWFTIKTETPISTKTKKDNDLKKISITPFAHMDSRALQKEKSDVLNFFPSKHKYKKTAPPKKKKPKDPNSAPKPAAKPLKSKETSTRGLRAKADVNYAVPDNPKEFTANGRKYPVKKSESGKSNKVKTEPSDENGESSDDIGEEKGNKDKAVNQFSDHPLFSILGGKEEWNEHEGETEEIDEPEEPEQSEYLDLSSFQDNGVSPADFANPSALRPVRKKAAPVYTSNPTEWGHPDKPDKDYSGKRYQCDYCDYGSDELTNIRTHIRGHTGEKPYKCKICNFRSSRSNSIKMHMRIHTGEKPFKCDLCGKAFVKSSNLIVHRKTHTGEKDYECSLCSDKFITPDQLRKHIRSHTGERPYNCKFCEKSFSDSSSLTRHTRIHTGEKPYKCDICDKTFSRKGTLTYHRSTHTGDKPYKCNMCDYANTLSFNLKRHMINTHLYKKKRGRPKIDQDTVKTEASDENGESSDDIGEEKVTMDQLTHLAKQAMNDTEEQMGEGMFNEMDEPDDPEEMYGAEAFLEEQAMEETQNIISKAMQAPGSAEDDRSDSQVKIENDTDNVGNTDPQTESEVKTEDTDDVGNQINEEEEKPESAKTLYKIKTWKTVKIKKPKHHQF